MSARLIIPICLLSPPMENGAYGGIASHKTVFAGSRAPEAVLDTVCRRLYGAVENLQMEKP